MFYISAIAFIMLVIVVIANVCLLYGCIKVSKLLHMNVYKIMIYTYICLFMTYSTNMIHSICIKTINVDKLNQTCHLCTENSIRNGWVYEIQVGFLYIYHIPFPQVLLKLTSLAFRFQAYRFSKRLPYILIIHIFCAILII